MEIYPSVHWLQVGVANCYLCLAEDGLTLIDSSSPNQLDAICNYIERIGRRPAELKHILITHADWDHAGSAAELQAETRATVYAGQKTAEYLQSGQAPRHLPRLAQWLADFMTYRPLPAATIKIVKPHDILPVWGQLQVVPTPGHTLDHQSFYSPTTGALFAGDALNTRSGRIQITPKAITADKAAAYESARKLASLAPALIACGHGRPAREHTSNDLIRLLHQS